MANNNWLYFLNDGKYISCLIFSPYVDINSQVSNIGNTLNV